MVPKTCGQQVKETRGRLEMTVRSEDIDDDHIRLHIGSKTIPSFSLTHTYTDTHTLPLSPSLTHTHTLSLSV